MTHTVDMPNISECAGWKYYALRMPHGSEVQEFLRIDLDGHKAIVKRKRRKGLVEKELRECALIDKYATELEAA